MDLEQKAHASNHPEKGRPNRRCSSCLLQGFKLGKVQVQPSEEELLDQVYDVLKSRGISKEAIRFEQFYPTEEIAKGTEQISQKLIRRL